MEKSLRNQIVIIISLLIIVGLLGNILGKLNALYIEIRYKVEYQNSVLHELEKEFRFFKCYMFDKKCREKVIIK